MGGCRHFLKRFPDFNTVFGGKLRLCPGAITDFFAALACQLVKMRPAFPY